MTEQVSFPGLGLEFDLNRVAFTIADRPIYWYGIIIAVAFLAGALYMMLRVKEFGLDSDRVMDVILGGVVCGIIGARLYYVLFSWDTYKENLVSVFYIRLGGMAIYGGIIGGVLAALLVCKWRKVKLLPMLDLAVGSLLLGQAIGRWGNFINVEAFGSNTTAAWGMTSPTVVWYLKQNMATLGSLGVSINPEMPVHPTFFYESMWCLLGCLFIAFLTKRRRFDGQLALIYLGWYGLGRFFIEGLRTDSLMLGSIRVSQMLALLCVLASVVALTVVLSKIKRANDPDYLPLYVHTDEGKAVLAGEFYPKKGKDTAAEEASGSETEADSGDEDEAEASDTNEAIDEDEAAAPAESQDAETTDEQDDAAGTEEDAEKEQDNGENN